MASKRRRTQLLKQDRVLEQRMEHRREAFSDLARKVGVVALVILLVGSGVWYFFLYEPGPERPEPWRLEDTEGNWLDSDDYYKSGVTLVEFFHSKCPHCNEQAPDLNNLHIDYRENLSGFFSIGGRAGAGAEGMRRGIHPAGVEVEADSGGDAQRELALPRFGERTTLQERRVGLVAFADRLHQRHDFLPQPGEERVEL